MYKRESQITSRCFESIKTVEQAEAKGYKNVQSVSSSIALNSGTESYMLSENATVTDMNTNKTVNTGFKLADGSYIGKFGSSKFESLMLEGLNNIFEKTVDDGKDNKKGSYK
ncbi:hypothetical protein [Myroides odoratus]|uniref:hypothetical protein n=1 Tax=Myroides odoratus TaxID=256 RepID=UPI00333E8B5F